MMATGFRLRSVRRAPAPERRVAIATARPLADCRTVAFDASASAGLTPLSYLWAFDGTGSIASDSPITRYGWSFGDGTVATGARTQKA